MISIYDMLSEEEVRDFSLSARMKWYEQQGVKLIDNNLPAIIRIDGKAFHTYTKGFDKPFDQHILGAMEHTMLRLCEEIQNVRMAYMQSDEISLVMTTHENVDKQPWFGGKVSKIVSVAASVASAHFNHYMDKAYWNPKIMEAEIVGNAPRHKLGVFDARVWNVPFDEVNNVMVWRQQDCIRNSVSALAQSKFSAKILHKKSILDMIDMLSESGIIWSDLPANLQRGFCAKREMYDKDGATRGRWVVDQYTPTFSDDTEYVNKHVNTLIL